MQFVWDPITLINLAFCVGIVIISIWWHRKAKSVTPLYIGIAFGLFGLSHAAVLLDMRITLEDVLIVVRVSAYILVFVGLFFVVRDVLKRKEAEESLRENSEFLDNIIENIPDMIFVKEAETLRFVRFNKAGEDLLGYSREDLYGKNDYDFFPPDEGDFFTGKDRKVLSEEKLVLIPEEPIQTRDKGIRILHTKKIPIFGKDKKPRFLLGISSDITEHKEAEQELARKNDELSAAYEELTSTAEELRQNYDELCMNQEALDQARRKLNLLNHVTFNEIKNSLFAFSSFLQLEEDILTDTQLIRYHTTMKSIISEVERMLDFTRDYQDMGIKPPSWQNVLQVFLFAISHLDITSLTRKISLAEIEIYADPLLEKVFVNLVENILVHGEGATEITLSSEQRGYEYLIILTDNGTGIPDSHKKEIFTQGFGVKKGMGLFLVREILSITNISIIENGVPGKGAQFLITVPAGAWRAIPEKPE